MDVLIVGAGSMGRWFGRAVSEGADGTGRGASDSSGATIAYADVDPDAAMSAAEETGGNVAPLEGVDDAYDVVCLAVPMTHVADAIEAHADRAERAVVDVSGIMGAPLEAMADHAPDRERVSLHPLFAPERAPGSIAVVRDEPGPVTDELLSRLRERGNDVLETTADEHDRAMETVQAATHAAVLSFAIAADAVPDGFETPIYDGLRELTRTVTEGTPRVYADIQSTFEGADAVADAAAAVAEARTDREELEALYRDAASRWHESESAVDDERTKSDESAVDDERTKSDESTENDRETSDESTGGDRATVEEPTEAVDSEENGGGTP
ncbi:prephenate dehydrogenase/arogenate dehydrogenase family protein [Natrialbaceae archaeon GCM10025810]|uniref:prephenate dehydrogenase/arogenate dehydrogenase family protein n=1 Tax=Halovalidus salilacus TaxID=3075124 RepID=UPI0036240CFA